MTARSSRQRVDRLERGLVVALQAGRLRLSELRDDQLDALACRCPDYFDRLLSRMDDGDLKRIAAGDFAPLREQLREAGR